MKNYNPVQDIFRFTSESSEPIIVYGEDMRFAFKNDFNPEKGQTPQTELERWLKFIYGAYKIMHVYDVSKDQYMFQKADNSVTA